MGSRLEVIRRPVTPDLTRSERRSWMLHRRLSSPAEVLPSLATMSLEIHILPIADTNEETARLAEDIEGVAEELSPFEEMHDFSIDGLDLDTSALPGGRPDRLVEVQNANTAAVGGEPVCTGWCLDKEDLCVAKLCAFRNKDQEFVRALLEARLVDRQVIAERLRSLPHRYGSASDNAIRWLASH
jgi:hypothetical protein